MKNKPILSVIIVSYNAKQFLYLTLQCIYDLIDNLGIEIIVIDNSPTKETITYCEDAFPKVIFLKLHQNVGFSKANNLGVKNAQSDRILILNPDIILSKETILDNIALLDTIPKVGAIGVKMIDGSGQYLPESKRSLPSLKSSFYKLLGIHKLFPQKSAFSSYYAPMENEQGLQEVEVLPGACIFIHKSLYETIHGFDERYFMYGEDIDLSYQILKLGYKNYYNPQSVIVHFKGESTKKNTWKYHESFYGAMKIFWDKNYNAASSTWVNLGVSIAIFFLKISSYLGQVLRNLIFPIIDFCSIYVALFLFTSFWETNIKGEINYYPEFFYIVILPFYAISWIFFLFLSKLYEGEINLFKLYKGTILGTVFILIVYFLVPENYRYSRAIVLIGAVSAIVLPFIIRLIGRYVIKLDVSITHLNQIRGTIVPSSVHELHIENIFNKYSNFEFLPTSADGIDPSNKILDIEAMSPTDMLKSIIQNPTSKHWFYLHDKQCLILSQSKKTNGLVLSAETNFTISYISNKILKRFLDIHLSLFSLILIPFMLLFNPKKMGFLIQNTLSVLIGNKTWISINQFIIRKQYGIKEGVFSPFTPEEELDYMRKYGVMKDILYFTKEMFKL